MPADTRDRIVQAGAQLFWRQGYAGTGMKQIVEQAGAPFGSVYHFFPGGKEALAVDAVTWSGGVYAELVQAALDASLAAHPGDVAAALAAVFVEAGQVMAAGGYEDACPIATIALEMSSISEPIREACAATFDDWTKRLTRTFVEHGAAGEAVARALATTFLTLLEGAFVLARAQRSTRPLEVAGRAMATAWRAAA